MFVSIKNLTANSIPELGLTANQTKAVWNNKPFWHPNGNGDIRPVLFEKIQAGHVVGLNEHDEVVIYWDAAQAEIISQDLADQMAVFTGQNFGVPEEIVKAERDAAQDIFLIMASRFRKLKQAGSLPNYNIQHYADALETKNVCVLLNMGASKQAGTAINGIATDAYFTLAEKGRLKAICDALDLG